MHFARYVTFLTGMAVGNAFGQSADTLSTEIASTLLQMRGAHVIPDPVQDSFLNLSGALTQTFGNTQVSTGQTTTTSQTTNAPSWSLNYTQSAQSTFESEMYTVITVDPGAPTGAKADGNLVRHYLANNVKLSGNMLQNTSEAIAGWFSPAPPQGSGTHRYTTLVFRQPTNFTPPSELSKIDPEIELKFNLQDYIQQTKLGEIVAATFFLQQNDNEGSASSSSVQPISTSAVPSASVAQAAASVTSSLSGATMTGSSSDAGNGAVSAIGASKSLLVALTAVAGGAFML